MQSMKNRAQPETAIFESIRAFGDDVDRNKILNAARSSAEALVRKQRSLQSIAKFKPTMTRVPQLCIFVLWCPMVFGGPVKSLIYREW